VVNARYGLDARSCGVDGVSRRVARLAPRLQSEQACDDLKAVLDAMIAFAEHQFISRRHTSCLHAEAVQARILSYEALHRAVRPVSATVIRLWNVSHDLAPQFGWKHRPKNRTGRCGSARMTELDSNRGDQGDGATAGLTS